MTDESIANVQCVLHDTLLSFLAGQGNFATLLFHGQGCAWVASDDAAALHLRLGGLLGGR